MLPSIELIWRGHSGVGARCVSSKAPELGCRNRRRSPERDLDGIVEKLQFRLCSQPLHRLKNNAFTDKIKLFPRTIKQDEGSFSLHIYISSVGMFNYCTISCVAEIKAKNRIYPRKRKRQCRWMRLRRLATLGRGCTQNLQWKCAKEWELVHQGFYGISNTKISEGAIPLKKISHFACKCADL